jgi:hypothetical protein
VLAEARVGHERVDQRVAVGVGEEAYGFVVGWRLADGVEVDAAEEFLVGTLVGRLDLVALPDGLDAGIDGGREVGVWDFRGVLHLNHGFTRMNTDVTADAARCSLQRRFFRVHPCESVVSNSPQKGNAANVLRPSFANGFLRSPYALVAACYVLRFAVFVRADV